jgi:hypothetical protein
MKKINKLPKTIKGANLNPCFGLPVVITPINMDASKPVIVSITKERFVKNSVVIISCELSIPNPNVAVEEEIVLVCKPPIILMNCMDIANNRGAPHIMVNKINAV